MNIEKIEESIKLLQTNLTEDTFIYDLLLAYGQPNASVTRLQKGDYNLSKVPGEVLWKKKLFFKVDKGSSLYSLIDSKKNDSTISKQHPRFLVVTDFRTLLAVDTHTNDTLDVSISDLAKNFDFFLPLAGMEKTQLQSENPADIKAAVRMGKLYDILIEENSPQTNSDRHALNIFLSRLLFCFFAEDTGIFASGQFTTAIASHTAQDGSDLQGYLQKLFMVLNLRERTEYPRFLQAFPYVNGGLFAEEYPVPHFSVRSRKIILECSALNWKAINPDIFGSMMQAVVHDDQRSSMGMHYTSVVNIMKVIKPLFLDELYEELEQAGNNKKKLEKLIDRLYHLRFFDPACGSGNFLIIAYKELCKLEIEIFKRLYSNQHGNQLSFRFTSKVNLSQFYGIEIDDFAHETAKLSLWLAEHQMNLAFREVFGDARPTLPLQDGGNITCGNATRLDWEQVCPKEGGREIYILGNPPYLGGKLQSSEQKLDLQLVASEIETFRNLDYVACWFIKAANYISNFSAQFAFVSTNSICQGEQVALLWPYLYCKKVEVGFAHKSFKWTNNAKSNAGIICVVIGIRNICTKPKYLFESSVKKQVKNINPYLASGKNLIVEKRSVAISKLPTIYFGSMPRDDGHLVLTPLDKEKIILSDARAEKFILKYLGSREFIRSEDRYCLWIKDEYIDEACSIPMIYERIVAVKKSRLASQAPSTKEYAKQSHRFVQISYKERPSIIIPSVSSERRDYIPIGFLDKKTVISNLAFAIYDPSPYVFAIISSRMHMVWISAVAGRLKNDYRYSSGLCYNTFPFPEIIDAKRTILENHVFAVLDEREKHSENSIAQLYDPDKMPQGLRLAHQAMDIAVEQCYRSRPFDSDNERLEYLFKLYEEMIEAENRTEGK